MPFIPNRVVAALCIAVIAFAAMVPGAAAFDQAWFEGEFVLLPHVTPITIVPAVDPAVEQPIPLVSVLSSRAPPTPSL